MSELERIRREYLNREQRFGESDLYSLFNPSHLFSTHQRQRVALTTLRNNGIADLSNQVLFEMGCGRGRVLAEFLNFGASPRNIYGMDLLVDRLVDAHEQLSASHFVNADGQSIPYPSRSFDVVLQYTALSSILDPQIRQRVAQEMLRILKPNGMILSYDFWLNPTNPQTRGIRPAEIKRLFPNCHYEFHRITLAPPITRKLAPISWGLCLFLESLKIFNTHYLVAIRPMTDDQRLTTDH
jgi:SAM-dependent methyltransferase